MLQLCWSDVVASLLSLPLEGRGKGCIPGVLQRTRIVNHPRLNCRLFNCSAIIRSTDMDIAFNKQGN